MRPGIITTIVAWGVIACFAPGVEPVRSPADVKGADSIAAQAAELRTAYAKPTTDWPKPILDSGIEHRELSLIPQPQHPKNNPYSKDKAELGKSLFFDGRLSGSGQMACVSCHDPDLAWADGRTVSFGHNHKPLKRNAPSVVNTAFSSSLFWDGRSTSLEAQAAAVLANPDEMRSDEKVMVRRLQAVPGYPPLFKKAFGDEVITQERVTKALACFERTLVGGQSRFDTFLKSNPDALSDSEIRGLHLFRTKAHCLNCHNGPIFSDGKFHDIGLSYYGRELEDLGRYRITKERVDVGAFRTPSLRNIGKTSPYMHNGLFELKGVLRAYNAGMPTLRRGEKHQEDPNFPTKSHLLKPLKLNTQDLADLEAFLRSLDEPVQRVRPPVISLPSKEN